MARSKDAKGGWTKAGFRVGSHNRRKFSIWESAGDAGDVLLFGYKEKRNGTV
jgi:hypothetical protein